MRSDPFLDFHRRAERAGYPALLVVSLVALALVVVPVGWLAVTRELWALLVAVMSIFLALALVGGELRVVFADRDEPARSDTPDRRAA